MAQSKYSVLELPLFTEKWQEDELDKKFECARRIYNQMLSHNLKKYNEMIKTKEWRSLKEIVKEELSSGSKKKSERLKAAYARTNEILRENGFSEFDFLSQAVQFSKYYQKHISSTVASMSIGKPMWAAFEKLLFGNGEKVAFKKFDTLNSIASDNKSAIRLLQDEDGRYYIFCSNRKAKARPLTMYIKGPNTVYDREMISAKTKVVRIVRKIEKGRKRFYVQLTVEAAPFIKLDAEGNLKHPIGTGEVGIAIWRGILYAVSDTKILRVNMSPNANEFAEKREELSREIEHLRRVNNPQNFNEDGTIKKGIIGKDGKRHRLQWRESNHYKKKVAELKELHRKHTVEKDLLRNKVILELLSMGDVFHFADTSFLTTKPEWNEEEPLPNSEYKKKKARRRAIQEFAPAMMLTKLDMKLANRNLEPIYRHTLPDSLYWYRHDKGISDETLFAGESIEVNGTIVNQTMYRAFLIRHFDNEIKGLYDQKALEEEWEKFIAIVKASK